MQAELSVKFSEYQSRRATKDMIKIVNEGTAADSVARMVEKDVENSASNIMAPGKKVRIQTKKPNMDLNEDSEEQHETSERQQSPKGMAGRRGGPRFDTDARSKASNRSKEKRKARNKSAINDKKVKKAMYHTANDGFYRKQSPSPSQDEDTERQSPSLPQKKRKPRKSKKRGGKAVAGHRQSGDRTAVSSIAVPGMEVHATPSAHLTATTPMEKSSTISYGKTNITTMKTPRGPAKEVVARVDSGTTMRLSMKRKL